jgi:dTDP-4-dehydrorhamnose reductase
MTGIDGLLGQALAARLAGTHELHGSGRNPLPNPAYWICRNDLTDPARVQSMCDAIRPDLIINTAALTDVDKCEDDPAAAQAVNGDAVASLAAAAPYAKLVQISTDFVFDGTRGPYREDDPVNPLTAYGKSKLAGERNALQKPGALVVRTAILYGDKPALHGKQDYVSYVVGLLRQGKDVRAATDRFDTPTHARHLAAAIDYLIRQDATGIYHVTGRERLDRASFTRAIAAAFGLDACLVKDVTVASLALKAPRPLNGGLCTDKLAAAGFVMPPLEQCLAEVAQAFGRP